MARIGIGSARTFFRQVKLGPTDPPVGIKDMFVADTDPNKINLAMGAYRDNNGKPWTLPSVRKAEDKIINRKMDKEYTSIIGDSLFYNKAVEVALGEDSAAIEEKRTATTQTLSGTGAMTIGAAFLANHWNGCKEVYITEPSLAIHSSIFEGYGFKVKTCSYYDTCAHCFNFDTFATDISKIPEESIIVLHACAHNPTGSDPSTEQWCEISELLKKNHIFPVFDVSYQGLASGDLNHDARSVRIFEADGHSFCLAQSFARNMGLYGERVGALTFVCDDPDEAARVLSQLNIVIRGMYSLPPLHGARIATEIFNDPDLYCQWLKDLRTMSKRLVSMRKLLKKKLVSLDGKWNWDHVTNQNGLFWYTGLNCMQVNRLRTEKHVYMTAEGRVTMSGVTTKNVDYLAKCIHDVTN